MSIEANSNGLVIAENGLKYFVTVPGNKPYCHFCRQRVSQVSVLERLQGNPLYICIDCLTKRLAGFKNLQK